jgi:hypothetical protein
MKTFLLITFLLITQLITAQTDRTSQIICSPNKDTLYIVKNPTTEHILSVWDNPSYQDEKPVFIYVTPEVFAQMAILPRYKHKSKSKSRK